RRSNPTPVKKRMELLCQNACGPWPGAALAPAVSGTVVSANAGVPADFGLHRKPIWRGVAKTGLEHGRGAALARAIQMQPIAAKIHQSPRRRIQASVRAHWPILRGHRRLLNPRRTSSPPVKATARRSQTFRCQGIKRTGAFRADWIVPLAWFRAVGSLAMPLASIQGSAEGKKPPEAVRSDSNESARF